MNTGGSNHGLFAHLETTMADPQAPTLDGEALNGELPKHSTTAPSKPKRKKRRSRAPTPVAQSEMEAKPTDDAPRKRAERTFPAGSFEDALQIANAIQEMGDRKVRRLTLFEHLKKAPDSGHSRQLVTNSSRYGITSGSYKAEHLELTDDGATATNSDTSPHDRLRARFRLAIEHIPPFKAIYEKFKGNKMPLPAVLRDFLRDHAIAAEDVQECTDTFTVNAKFVGILRTLAGAERLLSLDHAVDDVPSGPPESKPVQIGGAKSAPAASDRPSVTNFGTTCFYVTPIGHEDAEERAHSDLFMGSLIEPAMEQIGLKVVRADQIAKSGMITSQVLEYLHKSKLVIADLSFLNPNVFYEMALRHACKLPAIQIIRKMDRLPFDVNQVRTVVVDTTSIYSLVPQLDTYRAEIATQARAAIDDPDNVSNPITVFYPAFWQKAGI